MVKEDTKSKTKDKNEVGQVWNFKGRFADYMRSLTTDGRTADFKKIFDTIYHGYAFCALYGLLKGRKHVYDPKSDNPDDSPQQGFRWTSADVSGIYSYDNVRKMVLLFEKANPSTTFEQKIDLALRFDYKTNDVSDPDLIAQSRYKDNSDLVDQYVLGGLELIYEKVNGIATPVAMISFMNDTLLEFQKAYQVSNKLHKDSINLDYND